MPGKNRFPVKEKKGKNPRSGFSGSGEYLYGLHPVAEALRVGRRKIEALFLQDPGNPRFREIAELALLASVPVKSMPVEQLNSLTKGAVHQGAVLFCSPFVFTEFGFGWKKESPLLLVADGIEDPGNLGAMARTALCLGVSGLILPKDRSALPTPAAVKASAGALEHLPVFQVVNVSRTLETLRKEGFWIAGLDAAGEPMVSFSMEGPLVLVVGGEGRGIRPLVRKHCDVMLSIPQQGPVTSLNASVAAALAMYEIQRTRSASFGKISE